MHRMVGHSEPHYARSGELSIAYRVAGEGPPDVVFIPGFVSNVEVMTEVPSLAHGLERLGRMGRLVYFDKRGVGLSDRSYGLGTTEDRMDDLRAVMDAAGVERATIIGLSEGGPLALLFAAAYPERTRSLVLWGTTARFLWAPDYPDGFDVASGDKIVARMEERWGSGRALRSFVDLADDPATIEMTARYERLCATPRGAAETVRRNLEIDVRSVLDAIHVPTLILHRTGDRLVRPEFARYLRDHIEGAELIELPGDWHLSGYIGRDDDVFDAIERFVTGEATAAPSGVERVLAAVLFTDIVDSTVQAAEMGDRQWRAVLGQHDALVRRAVERHRGVALKQTGDGMLATFDGPGRAVRAAQAICASAPALGLRVRAGVHAGEVERRGDDVAGIAVHIGARLADLAGPGEVLVSGTVKDLVTGSGLEFDDRGLVELKGVPGEWRVFAAMG